MPRRKPNERAAEPAAPDAKPFRMRLEKLAAYSVNLAAFFEQHRDMQDRHLDFFGCLHEAEVVAGAAAAQLKAISDRAVKMARRALNESARGLP